jgi:hypothetical protein
MTWYSDLKIEPDKSLGGRHEVMEAVTTVLSILINV